MMSSDQSSLPQFVDFLAAEKKEPPSRRKAQEVWNEFINTLESLEGDATKQQRFLDLHEKKIEPIETTLRPGSAAAFPSDHAFNLLEQIKDLDRAWYRRYWRRIANLATAGGIGALIKWLAENIPNWLGFFVAGLIGYLIMDDIYDGGSIISFALIALLVSILFQLPDRRSKQSSSQHLLTNDNRKGAQQPKYAHR